MPVSVPAPLIWPQRGALDSFQTERDRNAPADSHEQRPFARRKRLFLQFSTAQRGREAEASRCALAPESTTGVKLEFSRGFRVVIIQPRPPRYAFCIRNAVQAWRGNANKRVKRYQNGTRVICVMDRNGYIERGLEGSAGSARNRTGDGQNSPQRAVLKTCADPPNRQLASPVEATAATDAGLVARVRESARRLAAERTFTNEQPIIEREPAARERTGSG